MNKKNRMYRQVVVAMLWLGAFLPPAAVASGHGPVFGAATPTLGKGGWSFDQVWMGRTSDAPDTNDQLLRTMISFGVTKDFQVSASLPIALASSSQMPLGRMMAMMSANREVEALAGWRFHGRPVGEGGRFESTAYFGATVPLESERAGVRTAPSVYTSAATGYASRAHYFWIGGGYQKHTTDSGDRLGDVKSYSVVYGYRPPALRLDYPKPDFRFFVEIGWRNHRPRDSRRPGDGRYRRASTHGWAHGAVALQGVRHRGRSAVPGLPAHERRTTGREVPVWRERELFLLAEVTEVHP